MGEPESSSSNGALNATSSADSSTSGGQDDQPPIAEPPDIYYPRHKRQDYSRPQSSGSDTFVAIEKPSVPHTLSAQQVAEQLQTHLSNGLSVEEAASRLTRDGPNTIKGAKGLSLGEILLQQVANALTVVLIAVAALSFAIQDFVEAGVVVAVIVLNIVVGYVLLPTFLSAHYSTCLVYCSSSALHLLTLHPD